MTENDDTQWGPGQMPPAPPVASPAGSALPPPPPRPAPVTPTAAPPTAGPVGAAPPTPPVNPTDFVTTGPIEAAPVSAKSRWLGRGVALGAAALLVGGGGYLAINAGTDEGGASTPQGALEQTLDALSSEDLIGAAEFVEPTERETMVEAGFEVVEELVRLELFGDDLDLGSVDGIDLEFSDMSFQTVEIRDGLAHVFVEGGQVTSSIDGAEFPLGSLITDRVDADTLAVQESASTRIEPTETPIVAVERGGRWYLSLWYTVAENARIQLGEPIPDPADAPPAVGGDSPEQAVELMIDSMVDFDLSTMIGMLDPQEAAALYDYAPLFLDDGQAELDEFMAEAMREGWAWDVTELELRADTDGDLATVHVDAMSFDVRSLDGYVEMEYADGAFRVAFEYDDASMEMQTEGNCVTMTLADGGAAPETEEFCPDALLEDAGLDALTGGILADLQSAEAPGIVTREVDGRWYVSPLRTGSAAYLTVLRSVDSDAVGEAIDALIEFAEDPFGGADSSFFGPGGFGDEFDFDDDFEFEPPEFDDEFEFDVPEFDEPVPTTTLPADGDPDADDTTPTTTLPEFEEFPPYTEENAGLLSSELESFFVYDLVGSYREEPWLWWLVDAPQRRFGDGLLAQLELADGTYAEMLILDGMPFEADEGLVEFVNNESAALVTDGDLTYVRTTTDWGADFAVARSETGIVLVGVFDGWNELAIDVLRTQLAG